MDKLGRGNRVCDDLPDLVHGRLGRIDWFCYYKLYNNTDTHPKSSTSATDRPITCMRCMLVAINNRLLEE